MVFYLSNSLVAALSVPMVPACIVNGLQAIADSRRNGQIEVVADRIVFNAAAKCSSLSSPARSVYSQLSEKSTQTRGIVSKCDVYVEVVDTGILHREVIGTQRKIVLPLDIISRAHMITLAPKLLCENLEDCYFLKVVGQCYGLKNAGAQNVMFDYTNGGGSTTAPNFDYIVQQKERLCLCIVDSDYKYCGDTSKGDTAKKVVEIDDTHNSDLCDVLMLECRESENMIPSGVLESAFGSDCNKTSALSNLVRLQSAPAGFPWRYIDVKKGLKVYEFIKGEASFQNEWKKHFGEPSAIERQHCPSCSNHESVRCANKDECCKYVVSGLGEHVLVDTRNRYFKMNSVSEVSRNVKTPVDDLWATVGKTVWAWGVAGDRLVL